LWTSPAFFHRRERLLAGAELPAEQYEIRRGCWVLQVVNYHRLLGGVPSVEVPNEDERPLAEEGVRVAGGDDRLGTGFGGVVSLHGPVPAQPLHAASFALLVVAQKQIGAHEGILDARGAGKKGF
jgi:hypothetical protein